jgi:predicted TIM-barrel fold metal-dependent hydrolase
MNTLLAKALWGESLSDVLIIDFHVHIGSRWNSMNVPVSDTGEMLRLARAVGVVRLVVNGCVWPDTRQGNDMVAALAACHGGAIIGFASLNPYQQDMVVEARRCFDELGMRGVKLHSMLQAYHTPRPITCFTREWDALFAFLSRRKAPVLYHGVVSEEMIRAWPDVPFVAAHGISDIASMERLARYPNFHVDTASTQNTAGCVDVAVGILGPERVLWGTDAPFDDFAQRLGVVLDSRLDERAVRQVLGLNAARLLGLERQQEQVR